MLLLSDLSGCELIALASVIAIFIAEGMDTNEVSITAAFFTSLGDNLALIAAARD